MGGMGGGAGMGRGQANTLVTICVRSTLRSALAIAVSDLSATIRVVSLELTGTVSVLRVASTAVSASSATRAYPV